MMTDEAASGDCQVITNVFAAPSMAALTGASEVVHVHDPREMAGSSLVTRRLTSKIQMYRYQLRDQSLLRFRFQKPITSHYIHRLNGIAIANVGDRFGTQLDIGGNGHDSFCFSAMLSGEMEITQQGQQGLAVGDRGLAFRARPGTRTLSSDGSCRTNLWIDAPLLESTLEQLLSERVRRPLKFNLSIAWDQGLAASLRGLCTYLNGELARPDGLATNPVALASFFDVLLHTVLRGFPHNHTDSLGHGRYGAVPSYLHRAEEFMRAHAGMPIRMAEIAAASGCSVRTLESVYRRFRDTTPLAALREIRLDQVQIEIQAGLTDTPIATIARQYGFTNPTRFRAAYLSRFGAPPRPNVRG